MMIFTNPGILPLDATDVMGVSVKQPGAFGFFGTGLKIAIASVLRGGGTIAIWCGHKLHTFDLEPLIVKGVAFRRVVRDGMPLGFTDQLGKTWEPWMVLRELWCNARDEGGRADPFDPSKEVWETAVTSLRPSADETRVVVLWPALDEAWAARAESFIDPAEEPLAKLPGVNIYAGESQFIFYRGVRVHQLSRPAAYRYDLQSVMWLTEDRTLKYGFEADGAVKRALQGCDDQELLELALTAGKHRFEHQLAFDGDDTTSTAFIRACAAHAASADLNERAAKLFKRHVRHQLTEANCYCASSEEVSDNLSAAIEVVKQIVGWQFELTVILVDDIEDDSEALTEDKKLYLTRALLKRPIRYLATQLLMAHAQCAGTGNLVELLLQAHDDKFNDYVEADDTETPVTALEEDADGLPF